MRISTEQIYQNIKNKHKTIIDVNEIDFNKLVQLIQMIMMKLIQLMIRMILMH